jgi:membrane protease YdiL (CAAX protease family)
VNSSISSTEKNPTVGGPVPQYSLPGILFMFAWPAAVFVLLIYIAGPIFAPPDGPVPTWVFFSVSLLANGSEFLAAVLILRREGYSLRFDQALRDRIHWRLPSTVRQWGTAILIFVLVFAGIKTLGALTPQIAEWAGLPAWMPGSLNPAMAQADIAAKYPDVALSGNILFLIVALVFRSFIFNILGEELYYRGVLLPKMKGVFGRWAWVANGILFAGKHAALFWMIPTLIPVGLGLAYYFGPLGSLPLAILAHWIGNDLDLIPQLITAVFGLSR